MDIEQGRLHNFGMMYSGDEDTRVFEEAYRKVVCDPWASLNKSGDILRSRQLQRSDLDPKGKRNLRCLELAIENRMPFFEGLPVTISYHGSTLYGSPVKNDMNYIITIDPNKTNRYVYADANLLDDQIGNLLVRSGVRPDSIVIENRGISNSAFRHDDYIKLLTAVDISLFTMSVTIWGHDKYFEIHRYYMELLYMDPELLTLTATVQENTLRYYIERWRLSDEFFE